MPLLRRHFYGGYPFVSELMADQQRISKLVIAKTVPDIKGATVFFAKAPM